MANERKVRERRTKRAQEENALERRKVERAREGKRRPSRKTLTCVKPAPFPKYPGAGAPSIVPMIEGRTTTARSLPAACASATASSAKCLVNVYALGKPKVRRIGAAIFSAAEAEGAPRILAIVPAWSRRRDEVEEGVEEGEEVEEGEAVGNTSLR